MSRSGDKQFQYGQYSLSYHIMLIFLIIGIICTSIIFAYLFHVESDSIESEFFLSQRYGEEALIHAIQLADQSLSFYDNAYNQPLRLALLDYQNLYHQSGKSPEEVDLEEIKEILNYTGLITLLYFMQRIKKEACVKLKIRLKKLMHILK